MAGRTKEVIARHNTELMKQVAELSDICSAREAEIGALKQEVGELREKLEDVKPETDVVYLRRELAYARGQLHQSHSTVKQLCGRRSTPDTPVPSVAEKRCEEMLDRIHNLLLRWEGAEADRINANDLAETFNGR